MRDPMPRDQIEHHRHTVAVAQRTALTEAVALLDARAKAVERASPGRRRGSVTAAARAIVRDIRWCADRLQEMRDGIAVPELAPDAPFLPMERYNRFTLERHVERCVPGTYPRHAGAAPGGAGEGPAPGDGGQDLGEGAGT